MIFWYLEVCPNIPFTEYCFLITRLFPQYLLILNLLYLCRLAEVTDVKLFTRYVWRVANKINQHLVMWYLHISVHSDTLYKEYLCVTKWNSMYRIPSSLKLLNFVLKFLDKYHITKSKGNIFYTCTHIAQQWVYYIFNLKGNIFCWKE